MFSAVANLLAELRADPVPFLAQPAWYLAPLARDIGPAEYHDGDTEPGTNGPATYAARIVISETGWTIDLARAAHDQARPDEAHRWGGPTRTAYRQGPAGHPARRLACPHPGGVGPVRDNSPNRCWLATKKAPARRRGAAPGFRQPAGPSPTLRPDRLRPRSPPCVPCPSRPGCCAGRRRALGRPARTAVYSEAMAAAAAPVKLLRAALQPTPGG